MHYIVHIELGYKTVFNISDYGLIGENVNMPDDQLHKEENRKISFWNITQKVCFDGLHYY